MSDTNTWHPDKLDHIPADEYHDAVELLIQEIVYKSQGIARSLMTVEERGSIAYEELVVVTRYQKKDGGLQRFLAIIFDDPANYTAPRYCSILIVHRVHNPDKLPQETLLIPQRVWDQVWRELSEEQKTLVEIRRCLQKIRQDYNNAKHLYAD